MRALPILALTGFLILPAFSATPAAAENPPSVPNAANTPDEAQKSPAGEFIQNLGNRAIGFITDQSLTPQDRNSKYREILRDSFDMKTIGHFVIGRAWNTATPEQQQEYMKLFDQLVVKTYGDRLNLYSGESFHVTGVRPESDKDFIVSSEISHPDGSAPAKIDWRVRQETGKLAVIDVVVEGVSQSVTQRDEYSSIIQRDGGKIDGLLNLMRQQVQQAGASQTQQQ